MTLNDKLAKALQRITVVASYYPPGLTDAQCDRQRAAVSQAMDALAAYETSKWDRGVSFPEGYQPIVIAGCPSPRTTSTVHDLYKTGDTDAPDSIKDQNGEVVLGLCRKCNKGEIELDGPCTPAQDQDVAALVTTACLAAYRADIDTSISDEAMLAALLAVQQKRGRGE